MYETKESSGSEKGENRKANWYQPRININQTERNEL